MEKAARKPLKEKTPETLRKILVASHKIFSQAGLEAATMDAIAAEAGLSKQILYYYFDGKEDLHAKVITEIVIESHRPLLDFDYTTLSPLDGLRRLFEASFDWNKASPPNFPTDQMILGGKFIRKGDTIQRAGQAVTDRYAELIARGQADGSIRQDVNPVFAHMLAWILNVGFQSSRQLLSRYLGEPILGGEAEQDWKAFAADVIIDSLVAKPA